MKSYKFTIHASPSHAVGDIVMQHITQTLHREDITGTIDQVKSKIQEVKEKLLKERNYDKNMGFSIYAQFWGGQRKPNGYDTIKLQLSANYINRA